MKSLKIVIFLICISLFKNSFANKVAVCPNGQGDLHLIRIFMVTKDNPNFPKNTVICFYTASREPQPDGRYVFTGKFIPLPGLNWGSLDGIGYVCTPPHLGDASGCEFTIIDKTQD